MSTTRTPASAPTARDYRRAAVLWLHWTDGTDDPSGINAVLAEIEQDQRITQTFHALLALIDDLCPSLGSPDGRKLLANLALRFATDEQLGLSTMDTPNDDRLAIKLVTITSEINEHGATEVKREVIDTGAWLPAHLEHLLAEPDRE